MAVQNPFFGRREPDALAPRSPSAAQPHHHSNGVAPSTSAPTATAPVASSAPISSTEPVGSKLTVGPNIKLKGVEITDCDTLVVEGTVEAT
ncbi:MAG TPA: polymer-forming cytoskeletal protein, partial [Giesbergeria sp.]|nr:polymer-forming cytoskeletal protein [Giesbergeria sp.]